MFRLKKKSLKSDAFRRQWLNKETRLRKCGTCQSFYMLMSFVITKEDLGVCMYVYEVFPRLLSSEDPFTTACLLPLEFPGTHYREWS